MAGVVANAVGEGFEIEGVERAGWDDFVFVVGDVEDVIERSTMSGSMEV